MDQLFKARIQSFIYQLLLKKEGGYPC